MKQNKKIETQQFTQETFYDLILHDNVNAAEHGMK